jgi:hypothetical protein
MSEQPIATAERSARRPGAVAVVAAWGAAGAVAAFRGFRWMPRER